MTTKMKFEEFWFRHTYSLPATMKQGAIECLKAKQNK